MWRLRTYFVEYMVVFGLVLLIGTVIATLLGAGPSAFPLAVVNVLVHRPFDVLFYATPLILSGIAVAIAGQAGLLNIGVEGQLYMGAFLAGIVGHGYGIVSGWPLLLHWGILLIVSVGIPGLIAAFAGWAKSKYNIHEVLTTLFSNFIILAVLNYLVNVQSIRDPLVVPQTRPVVDGLCLRPWIDSYRVHWGFGWAICSVVLFWLLLYRTPIGLRVRGVGENPRAHGTLGFSVSRIYIFTMFLSGAVAALIGVQRVLGEDGRYIDGFSPGYGFIGLGIAFAAQNRPIDVFVIACAFALLQTTGATLTYDISISREFVDFVQVLLLVSLVLIAKTRRAQK